MANFTSRVLLIGHYGFGNIGDETILRSVIKHLRELRPNLLITVATGAPEQTAETLGVETVRWNDANAVFEAVGEADLVIIGGGGIFHDYHGVDLDTFLTDNHWGVSFFSGPAVIAALWRKPVMLYAVGVGPLQSRHARELTRIACDAAVAITVRDQASKGVLETIGVPSERIEVTADPAFGFASTFEQASVVGEREAPARPRVAVVVRPWQFGVNSPAWEREMAAGLDSFMRRHGGSVVFLPFEKSVAGADDDVAAARRVHSQMTQPAATVFEGGQSPEQALATLSTCDLVVGMRLHSLILGMLARIPVVAVSYDTKVGEVMRIAAMSNLELDLHSLEAEELANYMSQALEERRQLEANSLSECARRNAVIAIEALENRTPPPALDPPFLKFLRRAVRAHLHDTYELRRETRRLYQLIDFYQNAQSNPEGAVPVLTSRVTELDTKLAEFEQRSEAEFEEKQSRLTERIEDLSAALEESTREAALKEHVISELRRRLKEERVVVAGRHRREVAEQARVAEEQHKTQLAEQAALAEQLRQSNVLSHDLAARLSRAEDLRAQVIGRTNQFQNRMDADLRMFRAQRAWRVMLAIRKAYTIVTRRGAAGFLRWLAGVPFHGLEALEEYDFAFQDVRNYLPSGIQKSYGVDVALAETNHRLADLIPTLKYDVIILAIFDFDFRFQRPQQIAAQFALQGHRVFWVSPGRHHPPSFHEPYQLVALRENLWEVRLRRDRLDLYGGTMSGQDVDSLAGELANLYRDYQISESSVLIQFPFWRRLGLALRDRFDAKLIYDCMDDWQNWSAEPRIGEFSLAEERALVSECDVLVVTSDEFFERYAANGLAPILIRNGADLKAFSNPPPSDLLNGIPRPIIGYYGAIADWFDLDLMAVVAAARPAYSFVLIGQVHQVDVSKLQKLPNVHLLGEKHYREIPLYLSHFDVCLIPFKLTPLTKGVDPVKMYEYLSQGKPIVATPMAELPRDPGLLHLASGADEFALKIDSALKEVGDPDQFERRRAFARSNTWAMRTDDIHGAIAHRYPLISVLIVTHNCEEFVDPCLESIARNTAWPNYEIIIVDNNSSDSTRSIVDRYGQADERIKTILQQENTGFANANNLAAQSARGEFLVFLNPDTIVTPGWLGRMAGHCRRDVRVGAVAAVTNFSGNETKVSFHYSNVLEMQTFALELAASKAGQATEIEMAALYCVLVPTKVWRETGGLDPVFKVGMFEDDDFSLRIRQAGYRVVAAEDCFVHHFGNGSFAKIQPEEAIQIFEQNRRCFESKWNVTWKPHQLRPGVLPPAQEPRFTPVEFLRISRPADVQPRAPITLNQLHPPSTTAGTGFNLQTDGTSALAVDCSNATPDTVIVMGSTILRTSYGSQTFLTGIVPADLYARVGKKSVYLSNSFGDSRPQEFEVIPPA